MTRGRSINTELAPSRSPVVEASAVAAMIEDKTYVRELAPYIVRAGVRQRTIKKKDTRVKPVTRPPNQMTSPYACRSFRCGIRAGLKGSYDQYNCEVLEYRVDGDAEVLLYGRSTACRDQISERTHQTFRPSVNDTDKEETDRKPLLSILDVEISKGYYSQFLDEGHTDAANSRLDAQ